MITSPLHFTMIIAENATQSLMIQNCVLAQKNYSEKVGQVIFTGQCTAHDS